MLLGEVLIANGFVSRADVEAALARQRESGGVLGENLIALGSMSEEALRRAMQLAPAEPRNLAETGLSERFLLNLLLKVMFVRALETPSELAEAVRLPAGILEPVLRFARENGLVTVVGSTGNGMLVELRHELTSEGRRQAVDQLGRSQYAGPAPVSMASYIWQIERQHITNERVARSSLAAMLAHLVLPESLVEELGPAVNSARAMLLYGPPGSGKTSIAEAMGRSFKDKVYIPHAIELDGQVITVFDPALHVPAEPSHYGRDKDVQAPLLRESIDARWVLCRRPTVMAGGELQLQMLDLRFSTETGVYEAPLQIKAMNGIFIIDDFGRQRADPRALLNRWILPLDKRFDFLQLHTGLKFRVPFDVLIVFSTNLAPEDLMDEAFLRRIPYKIHVGAPSAEQYAEIFRRACEANGIEIPRALLASLLRDFYAKNHQPLGSYHPAFLIDRVMDACRYRGTTPVLDERELRLAWRNLFVQRTEGAGSGNGRGTHLAA